MKQVLLKSGEIVVEEVSPPRIEPNTVLVRVHYSCISPGTELAAVAVSEAPLWRKALTEPSKVRKAMKTVRTHGLGGTWRILEERGQAEPLGYSAAGEVAEVGEGIVDLRRGDLVACAGAGIANHAEIVRVPRNLVVPIPQEVPLAHASTVTLGAIALQGIRRGAPTLGETFVVLGLGLLGQFTVQLLKANGCRVVAVDLDPHRVHLARHLGADFGIHDVGKGVEEDIARLTQGIGADGVIVTAGSPSNSVIAAAFHFCRKKGRVVVVGDVGLGLNRADIYEKELDFFISASYGPGRYDRRYEHEGVDYPVSYVRWTENRNMSEVLRLIADGKLGIEPLVGEVFTVQRAPEAYAELGRGDRRPLAVLLHYPDTGPVLERRKIPTLLASRGRRGRIRVAVVGTGVFAQHIHLPNLQRLADQFEIRAVVNRTGHVAAEVARRFGARYSSNSIDEVLSDEHIDAIIIATRHHLHATMALAALRADKHVLVEKPLALSAKEADEIEGFYEGASETHPGPVLMTGFNRRFSPHVTAFEPFLRDRSEPMIVTYQMNAGYLPADHWVHGAEGGGRNIGEACHAYDLFTLMVDAAFREVVAKTIRPKTPYYSPTDNFIATMSFDDGSVATLTYTSQGSPEHPKERMEVYWSGHVLVVDDYRRSWVAGQGRFPEVRNGGKGHLEELTALAHVARDGGPWPAPLWQQLQATRISFEVDRFLTTG